MPAMIDLGETYDEIGVEPRRKSKKPMKHYPTVYMEKVKLPFTATDVGKDFEIAGKIHVTGVNEVAGEHSRKTEYRFELRQMSVNNSRSRLKKALKKHKR